MVWSFEHLLDQLLISHDRWKSVKLNWW